MVRDSVTVRCRVGGGFVQSVEALTCLVDVETQIPAASRADLSGRLMQISVLASATPDGFGADLRSDSYVQSLSGNEL
jgi:hypothetical protein